MSQYNKHTNTKYLCMLFQYGHLTDFHLNSHHKSFLLIVVHSSFHMTGLKHTYLNPCQYLPTTMLEKFPSNNIIFKAQILGNLNRYDPYLIYDQSKDV